MKKILLFLGLSVCFTPAFAQIVANFSGTPTTICVGQSVSFTDLSTGSPTAWNWNFTGGTPGTSTLQNPTVVYNTAGVFGVSLTASAGFLSDIETKPNYITVIAIPAQPAPITGLATVCAGQAGVTYSIPAVAGATSYTWTVPAGSTVTSGAGTTAITVTFGSTSGNVCVTANNTCGASVPRCLAVTVNSTPATPGPITGLNAVCANQIGLIYSIAAVTGATSYTWTVPAGATITAGAGTTSITVNWGTTSGNVCVTASNTCGTSAASCLAVSVVPGPPATPGAITGLTSVCANQAGVTYSIVAVVNASAYNWTLPAGATITAGVGTTSITVTFGTTSGNVCVAAVNGCGTSAASCLAVTVNLPPAQPGAITGSATVCAGQVGVTYSIAAVTGATSYTWTVPAGATVTSGAGTTAIVVTFGSTSGNVCVTANNPCPSIARCLAVTVNSPPATPGTITGVNSVCSGDAETYDIIAVAGATTYTWTVPVGAVITAGQGTTSLDVDWGTTSGNVCVTASNSCGTSAASCLAVTVNSGPPAAPGPVTGLTPVCINQTGVVYSITAVTGASSYTWTVPLGATIVSGQGTTSIVVDWGFSGGNVCVTATNGCGTSAATCLAVTMVFGPPAQPGAITGSATVCAGQTGVIYSITAVATATTYTWTVPAGATITAGAGTISITVTFGSASGNVCVTAGNVCGTSPSRCLAITVNPSPIITAEPDLAFCVGAAVPLNAFVSTPAGATYAWTNSNTAIGLVASGTGSVPAFTATNSTTAAITGTITVTPTLAGCTGPVEIYIITVNPLPTVSVTPSAPTICTGGSVSLTASGASTYAWSPATGLSATIGATVTATPAATTTYTVTGTSAAGCTNTATVTVTVVASLTIAVTPSAPTICSGSSVSLTASGATTYAWTPATGLSATTGATVTAIPTTTTTYTVTGTSGSCTNSTTVTVTVNPSPIITAEPDLAFCVGAAVPLNAFVSTPAGATYTWTNSNTAIGLVASGTGSVPAFTATNSTTAAITGTITVTPTLAGCTGPVETYIITVNPLPVITAEPDLTFCAGAAVPLNAFVSTPAGATYTWTNSNTAIGLVASGTGSVPAFTATNSTTAAITGTITVTPTLAGCAGPVETYIITVRPLPVITAEPDLTFCAGAAVPLNAFVSTPAGATYAWTNSNTAIGLVASGTGSVPAFTATNSTTAAITGTITVTPTLAGCAGPVETYIITVNPLPTVSVTPSAPTICTGGSVSLTASGASTYAWSPATGLSATTGATVTATPAATTTYTITGTSASGCTSTATVTVGVVPSLTIAVTPSAPTICSGTSVSLTASGATTYAWTPATGLSATTGATVSANPTATTTYTVTGTSGSCTNSTTVTVTVNPLPVITAEPDLTFCAGAAVPLNAFVSTPTGATYTWTNSNTAIGLVASGTGSVPAFTATNSTTAAITGTITVTPTLAGCTGPVETYIITVNPSPIITAEPDLAFCAGAAVPLNAFVSTPAGATYTWTNSNTAIGLVASGTGSVPAFTATNSTTAAITGTITVTPTLAGCTGPVETYIITVNPLPTVSVTPSAPTICTGGSVALTASGASTYAWSPATGLSATTGATVIATPAATTTYTVTGTSASGCINTATVTVTVVPSLTIVVTPSAPAICAGSSVSLTASGATTYAWTPATGLSATTGATVTANPTATTTYTVTGISGSCTNSTTVTVTVNPLPTVSVTPSAPAICDGSSVSLTASGASTYAWSPATGLSATTGATVTANPTATTTYTVTGTSAAGCTNTATVTVIVNPLPTVSVTPSAPTICTGGSVSLTASGASTYAWSPATGLSATTGATVTSTPAATTTYTITGTSASGCTNTATVTVTVVPSLTIVVTPSAPAICAGSSVSLTASGATTYAWTPATGLSATTGATVTANPAATTTYTVIGTSGSCSNSTTVTVTVNPLPTVSVTPSAPAICDGSSVSLTAIGASTYAWSPATGLSATTGATVTANPTATTTYTVTGTSAAGCTNTSTVTVTVNPLPTVSVTPSAATICTGGSVSLTASGASTYAWSPATGLSATTGATVTATPTATTTYTITGTSASGCTNVTMVTITVDPLPTVSITPSSSTICAGSSVSITASGASTYSWSPSTGLSSSTGATVTASPTATTTYTVTGTATGGCTNTSTITITVNPIPTVSVTPSSAAICEGATVSLTAGGASTYSWSPSTGLSATTGATVTASPASTITYTVIGTTAGGCTNSTTVTITVNPLPIVTVGPSSATICSGSSVSLTASGATTYTWSPATGLSATTGATVTANPTATTTYTITGTSGSCSSTTTVTITVSPLTTVSVTPSAPSICEGSSVSLTASGAVTYSWSPSTGLSATTGSTVTASPAATTTYTVVGTDASGCSNSSTVTITIFPTMTLTTSSVDATCGNSDGSASVVASGGAGSFTYLWSDLATQTTATAINLAAGAYNVTVTDGNSCSQTASVAVNNLGGPVLIATSTDVTCNGGNDGTGTVSATAGTPPYTYLWNDAAAQTTATATTLIAGTFAVTVTDNAGCIGSAIVTINEPTAITLSASSTNATCGNNDGSATVSASGGNPGYTYLWNDAAAQTSATATNLAAGTYIVIVTDNDGCSQSTSIIVNTTGGPSITLSSTGVSCFGGNDGTATASVTGGISPYTYLWTDASTQTTPTATGLSAGSYTVTVTDNNGCTASGAVAVATPSSIALITTSSDATCGNSNGSATVTASGGTSPYSYLWNDPASQTTATAVGLAAGAYIVVATDNNGCSQSTSVTINGLASLAVSAASINSTCFGLNNGTATAATTGGSAPYSYLWSDPLAQTTQTATNLAPGSYMVTVTDSTGCIGSDSVTITEPTLLVLNTTATNSTCGNSNGTATVNVTGGTPGYSYSWSDSFNQSDSTAYGLTAGTYTVTVIDNNGCSQTGMATVNNNSNMNLSLTLTHVSCNGGNNGSATITITGGIAPYTYLWSDSTTVSTITGLQAGTYTVTITDSVGCSQMVAAIITEPAPFTIQALGTGTSCGFSNGSVIVGNVSGGTSPFDYSWSNGATSANIINVDAGTYSVTVTDADGCMAIDTTTITDTVTVDCVFIPNAFSPNGDGEQDVWVIDNIQYYDQVRVEIYNRWGNLVYASDNYKNDWDGTRNGVGLPGGVYFYIVDFNNEEKPKSGSLTIIR